MKRALLRLSDVQIVYLYNFFFSFFFFVFPFFPFCLNFFFFFFFFLALEDGGLTQVKRMWSHTLSYHCAHIQ